MLTGIQALLIGGDHRQIEVIKKFSELDASVHLIGFDELQHPYIGVKKMELEPSVFRNIDVLILPPVGTDDEGRVESVFTSKLLVLEDSHIEMLPKHARVVTGMAKPYLKQLCADRQIELIELFERDDVAIYNSIPTAEGALMMAIQHTEITIHSSRCMVLGMGRTGLTLARVLQGIGAHVRVGVRKSVDYARAMEMGINPFYVKDLAREASDVDLIFNTIPTMIVTANVIAQIPLQAVIIDLASKPGGTDFRFAERRGIKALLAPGLPGIVAPKTAGQIIANTLCQVLMEDNRKRSEA